MTNQAWECPRCHKINAPITPWCDCKPNYLNPYQPLGNPYTAPNLNNRCLHCNGYHGIFQGRDLQCVDLQNGVTSTYCNGQAVTL